MATRSLPDYSDGEAVTVEFDDVSKLMADREKEEAEIAAEFTQDHDATKWKVKVCKIDDKTKDWEDCFYCTPEDFPILERLRKEHGPGVYRALVYRNGKIHRNMKYRVAPKVQPPENSFQGSPISDIAKLIERQNEQIANIMQRGNPAPVAAPDPVAQMGAMMTVMLQMKELMPAPAPATGVKDFIELLSVAKELSGDGGNGKGVMDVLAELVKSPIAGEIADQFRAQRQSAPVDGGTIRARQIPPAQIVRQAPPTQLLANLDQPTLAMLKSRVDFWIAKAAKNSDPGLYAEVLLDDFSPEMVAGLVAHPELWPSIVALNPLAGQYQQWFAEFFEAVNQLLTSGEELEQDADDADESPDVPSGTIQAATSNPNVDPGRGSGGSGDAGNHAPVSPRGKKKPVNKG